MNLKNPRIIITGIPSNLVGYGSAIKSMISIIKKSKCRISIPTVKRVMEDFAFLGKAYLDVLPLLSAANAPCFSYGDTAAQFIFINKEGIIHSFVV